jgi:hypothetical protein
VLEAQRVWTAKVVQLKFLMDMAPRPFPERDAEQVEARSRVREIETPPTNWRGVRGGPDPVEKWRSAFTALQNDASTKLPSK